jgi:hypothetical protein
MSKMIISENRLQELINESIYEVLNESEFDEGFGHWLGQTYQGIKNRWNNFRKDIEAGRDKAQFDNKDYNAYSHFGDEENEIRKMRGQNVTNDTTETQSSSTTQNTDSTQSNDGQEPSANNGTIPHPSLVNTQQNQEQPQTQTPEDPVQQQPEDPVQQQPEDPVQQQPEDPVQQQPKPKSKREELQARLNNGNYPSNPQSWMRKDGPSPAMNRKIEALDVIKKAGMVPQGGNWNDQRVGWDNVNGGGLTDKQKEILKYYKKFLYENELIEIKNTLNELKTRLNKK